MLYFSMSIFGSSFLMAFSIAWAVSDVRILYIDPRRINCLLNSNEWKINPIFLIYISGEDRFVAVVIILCGSFIHDLNVNTLNS